MSKILEARTDLTHIDLSLNNLGQGLEHLVGSFSQDDRLICLKLKNNNIDGRQQQDILSHLLLDHPSLTSVDLGNSENIQNRNRIFDEGCNAILEGMAKSEFSLISELYLQSASITADGLFLLS